MEMINKMRYAMQHTYIYLYQRKNPGPLQKESANRRRNSMSSDRRYDYDLSQNSF